MFSTLRRLLVLAAGTVSSAMFFAPVAFAEKRRGDGGGPDPSTTAPHHAAAGSSLATWQWLLISVGIIAAVAGIVAVAMTVHRRTKQTGTLRPRTP